MTGGKAWKAWQKALSPALLGSQVEGGVGKGSWEPEGAWCYVGGRVFSTAMAVMALQKL